VAISENEVAIRIRLAGAKAAAAEAAAIEKEVSGLGSASERAAAKSRGFGRAQRGLHPQLRETGKRLYSAAKGVALLGAAYVGAAGIKSSIDTTESLAEATISLHKNLGLSVEKASEWAAVARSRNIDTKAMNMSFGTLSKNIHGATKAGSSQAKTFQELGVSQKTLASGDFNKVLGATSDALNKMGPGANRTAIAMSLFGRGWQTIVPVLRDGSKGMNEQLNMAKKYGATFQGHTVKSMHEFVMAQRESKMATMGLQIALGTQLIPILTKGIGAFSKFVLQMRQGKGAGGKFADTAKQIWQNVKPVALWFGHAAINVAKFAAKHPKVAQLAAAVFLTYRAFKKLGGGVVFSVVKQMGSLISKAAPVVARFGAWVIGRFATIGATAGTRFSARSAGKAGGATGVWSKAGGAVGAAFGIAAAAAFVVEFGPPIDRYLQAHLPKGTHLGPMFDAADPNSFTKPGTPSSEARYRAQQHWEKMHPSVPPIRGGGGGGGRRSIGGHAHKPMIVAPQTPMQNQGAPTGGAVQLPDVVVEHTTNLDGKAIYRSVTRHAQDRANRR
jgi:hypothetical protein